LTRARDVADTLRTSLGFSSDSSFSINVVGNVTTTTLSQNYPGGKYSIISISLDTNIDVYAYNSGGTLVGTSSGLVLTTSGVFNKIVIVGGEQGDTVSFVYNQSAFISTSLDNQTTAPATISSIVPTFVNTVNQSMDIVGTNFASNATVYFKGTDGTERAADSVTRNSVTSLTITSPDTLPTEYSPYSIVVENPGVARPTLSNKNILQDAVSAAGTIVGWTRPADWLTLTAPASNEQKFVGLLAITNDDSNYVALLAQGNYTVDWGDGSAAENFTSNTKASHKYTYSSISSGTLTSAGYKQVIITVTPQAGQSFTMIDLQQTFTRTNLTTNAPIPWLDIAISGTSLTTIKITGSSSPTFRPLFLERVNIVSSNLSSYANLFAECFELKSVTVNTNATVTSTANMFLNCRSIESIPLFTTSSVTDMSGMFNGCQAIETVPLFNTSSVANMSSMFRLCLALVSVPLFTTTSVTNMSNMFEACTNLTSVPLFNTPVVTNMGQMFYSCTSLTSVPLFNTASVTNMASMFNSCYSLKTVPLFNTVAVTSMSSMFDSCYSLTSVPLFTTSSVTDMSGMFNLCRSLESVPLFNTAAVTTMSSMFGTCTSLKTVPLFNTASVTNMASMFNGCTSLKSVPLFNTAAVTSMSSMFNGCYSLTSVPLFNTAAVTTMASMFNGCYSLKTVPLFNTAAVTTMASMFSSCHSLQSVPLFTTTSVTSMSNMFNECINLKEIPNFNITTTLILGSGIAINTFSLQSFTLYSSVYNITTFPIMISTTAFSNITTGSTYNSISTSRALKRFNVNCTAVTSAPATSLATYFPNLSSVIATGMRYAFSVLGCRLDGTALDALYTSLGTAAGAQTLTVTSNHGTVDDTPSIATAKGWTVTGS
jgi:surface protein